MLEIFTHTQASVSPTDAIALIKHDHNKVKSLFDQFERANDLREKKKIVAEAIMELKLHAEVEEKLFYPTVRDDVEGDTMNEADEEHHVAKLLIAELDQMDGSEEHWEAKFTVLAENIRHHIKEEEGEMLPQASNADVDFEAIGRKLLAMKQQLKKEGIPPSDEEKLIAGTKGRANSPVRAAQKAKPSQKKSPPKKSAKGKSTTRDGTRSASRQTARKKRTTSIARGKASGRSNNRSRSQTKRASKASGKSIRRASSRRRG